MNKSIPELEFAIFLYVCDCMNQYVFILGICDLLNFTQPFTTYVMIEMSYCMPCFLDNKKKKFQNVIKFNYKKSKKILKTE